MAPTPSKLGHPACDKRGGAEIYGARASRDTVIDLAANDCCVPVPRVRGAERCRHTYDRVLRFFNLRDHASSAPARRCVCAAPRSHRSAPRSLGLFSVFGARFAFAATAGDSSAPA